MFHNVFCRIIEIAQLFNGCHVTKVRQSWQSRSAFVGLNHSMVWLSFDIQVTVQGILDTVVHMTSWLVFR
jgi:hypothetical protein